MQLLYGRKLAIVDFDVQGDESGFFLGLQKRSSTVVQKPSATCNLSPG
jgi:hypothetical protein